MKAISMDEEGRAQINHDRCIGCGLCVAACPTQALELAVKAGDKRLEPPPDTPEQMHHLARKRGFENTDDSEVVFFGFDREAP